MRRNDRRWWVVLLASVGLAASGGRAAGLGCGEGVFLEAVEETQPLAQADLRPGDRLVSWQAGERGGRLTAPFDWAWLAVAEGPRGPLLLHLVRDGEERTVELPRGPWHARVRPPLPPELLARYRQPPEDEARLAAALPPAADPCLRAWALLEDGDRLLRRRSTEEARAAFTEALELAPTAFARGLAEELIGWSYEDEHDFAAAEGAFRRALAVWEEADGRGLTAARALDGLARLAWEQGALDAAQEHLEAALDIQQRLAPGTLLVASSWNGLGALALQRGDFEAATAAFERALAVRQALDPEGASVAATLNNVGVVARRQGDYAAAEEAYRHALAIRERVVPGTADMAESLANLGIVAEERGHLDLAEARYRRALEIYRREAPGGLEEAAVLNNLGVVAYRRGDWDTAESVQRQALAIRERLAPGRLDVATSLENLALVSRRRGRPAEAEGLLRRAVELTDGLAPGSLQQASQLANLGSVLAEEGAVEAATEALDRGLAIQGRLAPGSWVEVELLSELGRLRRADDPAGAAELLWRAVAALDEQLDKLGGVPEAQTDFRKRFADLHRTLVAVLLEARRPEAAFTALERFRARSFLATLTERELLFPPTLPPALAARRRVAVGREREVERRLAQLEIGTDDARIDALLPQLSEARAERHRVAEEARAAAPGRRKVAGRAPLDLAGVQAALDPGTVLLTYSVGPEATWIFALPYGGPLTVRRCDWGADAVEQRVDRFRGLLREADGGSPIGRRRLAASRELGRELYRGLVEPVEEALAGGARILVVPDGALHLLPFAALVRGAGDDASYLVEWRPLHFALSGTAYAELRQRQPTAPRDPVFLAFADPSYGETAAGDGARSRLAPLPASRSEVEAVAALFGGGSAVYLGEAASERRVRSLAGGARYLHFAVHGVLDERLPLDSRLALAPPAAPLATDDGFLHAWEVLEELPLAADLVVLSACGSALGEEGAGEGLIGLARSFFLAGARSVLASLWEVRDRTSVELMTRFYRALKDGTPKDEALAAAQVELLRGTAGEAAARPASWAAFELFGDRGSAADGVGDGPGRHSAGTPPVVLKSGAT